MFVSLILAAATAATSPSSVPARPTSASAPPASVSPTKIADDDKVTCKEEAITGSMIADRVCHTNAQWRQMQDDAQDDMRRNPSPTASSGSGH